MLGHMRQRDSVISIVTAVLIALASYLHAHVVAVSLLGLVAFIGVIFIAYDVGRQRGVVQSAHSPRSHDRDSDGSISAGGSIRSGKDIDAAGHISAGNSSHKGPPQEWVSPGTLGTYLDEINTTMEERGFGRGRPLVEAARSTDFGQSLSWTELNEIRVSKYEENRGLFLKHSSTPSTQPGQVANVIISIAQHGDGPLTHGTLSGVQYTLGPKFSQFSHVITDPTNNFATAVAMFGPMLCLAEISFDDGTAPLILERYIDI